MVQHSAEKISPFSLAVETNLSEPQLHGAASFWWSRSQKRFGFCSGGPGSDIDIELGYKLNRTQDETDYIPFNAHLKQLKLYRIKIKSFQFC
jgi:hypothetical protein